MMNVGIHYGADNSYFQLKGITMLERYNRKLKQWNALHALVLNLSKRTIYIVDKTEPALKINILRNVFHYSAVPHEAQRSQCQTGGFAER